MDFELAEFAPMLFLASLIRNGLSISLLTRLMQVVGDAFNDDSNCFCIGR